MRPWIAWLALVPLSCHGGPGLVALGLVNPAVESDSTSLLRGVQMAVSESGLAGGPAATLEVRGSSGQWGTTGNDAVSLVAEAHVDGIVAPSDGAACHLVLQVSGRTRVPVATLCPDASATETGVPWAVRVVPRTEEQAETLLAAPQPGPSPAWWAVIPADNAGRSVRRDLHKASRVTGVHVDSFLEVGPRDPSLAPLAQTLVAASPGGVLIWLSPPQTGALAAALRGAGYAGRLAGPCTSDSPDFAAAAGSAGAGFLVAEFQSDSGSRSRAAAFEARFLQQFGTRPDFSAASAYDAAKVLIENLGRSTDTTGHRRFPPSQPTGGVTGDLRFDSSGNRTGALQVLVFQNGRFTPLLP